MEIVESIKDTARKASNSLVDTTEQIIGIPKSPKELAKRLVEHLIHEEYQKIPEIITREAKKYLAKMGLDDITPVSKKLEEFEHSMDDLAKDLADKNYHKIVSKLKEVERLVSDQMGEVPGVSDLLETIKSFLNSITKTLEEYANKEKEGSDEKPDFSKLQNVFEGYFNKLIAK